MDTREELAEKLAKQDGRLFLALDKTMKAAYLHNADVEMSRSPTAEPTAEESSGLTSAGLLYSLVGKRTGTPIDVLWGRVRKRGTAKMKFPHIVSMPCGKQVTFDDAEHIMGLGIENIKCSCGDPTHFIVRFEDKRESSELPASVIVEKADLITLGAYDDREKEPVGVIDLSIRRGEIVTQTHHVEEVANDDSNKGTGQLDTPAGSSDTGKPEQPEKPKAKRKARKRAKKLL